MVLCDKPLGLPEGSVRAIITLGVVGTALYAALETGRLPEWLLSATSLIIGHYFGSRKKI